MTASAPPHPASGISNAKVTAIALAIPLAAVVVGLLAGALISADKGVAVFGLAAIGVPVLIYKRPYLAPATLLLSALLIEQFPDPAGHMVSNLTGHVPLFHGLGAAHLSPADLLLGSVCVMAHVKARHRAEPLNRRTPLGVAVLGLFAAAMLGLVMGALHHGVIRMSLMEIRPYIYLTASFYAASTLLTDRRAMRAVLWAIVIDGTFKGLQAMMVFMSVRHMVPRPDAVLGHEEALFFGIFVMVVASLWLFGVPGRMRTVATWALPIVLAGDLANSRRTAWLVLGGGLLVLAAVAFKCVPARRLMITRVAAFVCVALAIYMPAYWNKSGGLAQPARAIRSMVAPSTRDASSDLYRVQEDANLKVNIRTGGLFGRGFGVPIDYPLPITDITELDAFIGFVPHDGILYVLMRMGLLGGIAVWGLLGTAIITACKLARSRDRELAAIGSTIVAVVVGYTLEAAVDQGFFLYRVAFVMGTLLGLCEAARRLEAKRAGVARAEA